MRLHHLRLTAFGPFPGTVEVDFDELGAAGLFLLTGATGAGKTTLLDAVCFGLYGAVPGDRQEARHLRCDLAAPTVAPEVVLTATIRGRRFRFTRAPAWQRPKRRGTGMTTQQARVVVEEERDGTWTGLTTRLDDAGLLVSDLLGMTCVQYTQVAMLPQGRFQAFLRATSSERHQVLQRLFRTDRFERVERWLVEHRLDLRRQSLAGQAEVVGVLHRLEEAASAVVPDGWVLDDLAGPAAGGEVLAWAESLREAAVADHARSAASLAAARATLDELGDQAAHAARLHDLHRRATAAAADRSRLAATATEADALTARVATHRRAAPAAAVAARAEQLDDAVAGVRARLVAALAAVGTDAAGLDDAYDEAVRRLHTADGAAARERDLRAAEQRLAALLAEVDEITTATRAETLALESAPATRAELCAEIEVRGAAALRLPELVVEAERAARGHDAAVALAEASVALDGGRRALEEQVDLTQRLRDAYLDAREARISSVAAELAGALASGCSCPVCGSTDHPAPAVGAASGGRAEEDEARRAYEDADFRRITLLEEQAALQARIGPLEADAGEDNAATWAARRSALDAEVASARAATAALPDLRARLDAHDAATADRRAHVADLEARRAATRARIDAARTTSEALDRELTGLLDGFETADDLLADRRRRVELLGAARRVSAEHDQTLATHHDARRAAEQACREAGFVDLDALGAALLTEAELADAEEQLAVRARVAAAADAVLAEPGALEALETDLPDLAELTARLEEARVCHDAAAMADGAAERRAGRAARLVADLERTLAAWAPVREAAGLASALASFAEGKSVDNPLRMRLSAYVLSERLRRVVEAANVRLRRMTADRYTLEHTDERGVGAQRGGLSLLVRDAWSGATRDPATLSGGETFVVSLALALGLADTVAHEAGGTDIDTLFIDEGFGSLDADTLDDVVDTLDSLREGGRVVGVVSHVGELRERITARLEVRKGRRGSSLVMP